MKIVPRFTITDLLIATAGCAVILMLWLRIPVYEDWHWNYDLLPYKTQGPPREFIDNGRQPPQIPTPWGIEAHDGGPDLYRAVYRAGFGDGVTHFTSGDKWPPEEIEVAPLRPDTWTEQHVIRAYEDGFAGATREINALLATRHATALRTHLDRDRSYNRKFLYPIGLSLLLVTALFVRVFRTPRPDRATLEPKDHSAAARAGDLDSPLRIVQPLS